MNTTADIAIVGGGIAGLAHAWMALNKGYRVVLFEREEHPVGASIRNFGMVWPIGQEPGENFSIALRSTHHWKQLAKDAGFWINNNGSLHLAYHEDEWAVLNEFYERYRNDGFQCELLTPAKVLAQSPLVKRDGLLGALYSTTESVVYSRQAIPAIFNYLEQKRGMIIRRKSVVTEINLPIVRTAAEQWKVDKVIVCSGADFETLYPEVYQAVPMTKCKLQMMKASAGFNSPAGPSLCAGLTLRHYKSFSKCPSLPRLDRRYDELDLRFKENGIHVLISQDMNGDLIIGDSHHYGNTFEPFDSEEVNKIILDYMASFTKLGSLKITQRWHGIYPKLKDGTFLVHEPAPGVTLVNGFGGAGMTLSFGLAEKISANW